jgi:hypothetical protein
MLKLSELNEREASLIQRGLKASGYYKGTCKGRPGPRTKESLDDYLAGTRTPIAQKLIDYARAELGVRESPVDSNRGTDVYRFQKSTWLAGSGWPWCAAFICFLCQKAGMTDNVRPRTAGAWDFENWARRTKANVSLLTPSNDNPIQAGDILVYKFSHIGLATKDEFHGIVSTIEGNTDEAGSREGGGVYEKTRSTRHVRSIIRIH